MTDLHIIWLGSDIPVRYQRNIESYTSDYNVTVWTKPINLINQDLFDRAKSYALKADIMRLELLAKYGGVYTDIDSKLISPMPIESGLVCMTSESGYISNATIYATKGHPAVIEAIRGIPENVNNLERAAIFDIAGATYLTPIFQKYDHVKLPRSVVGKIGDRPSSIVHSNDASWAVGSKTEKRPINCWINEHAS